MGKIKKEVANRICKECGREFKPEDFRQIYCNVKCRNLYNTRKYNQKLKSNGFGRKNYVGRYEEAGININEVATRLKNLRLELGLSGADVSKELGISYRYVNKWEQAAIIPSISIMVRLSVLYSTSIDYIIFGGTI